MRLIKSICLILILSAAVTAQKIPQTFEINKNNFSLKKISNPAGNSVNDIAVNNDIIWIVNNEGLSKSTDNGLNWINFLDADLRENESAYYMDYYNGVVWVTLGHSVDDYHVGGGIIFSEDDGDNWNYISQPVDDPGDSILVYGNNNVRALPVTVLEKNISWDIEYNDGVVWVASFAGGLRKSTDMGNTWQRVLLPADHLDSIKPTDEINFALQTVKGAFGDEEHLNHRVFCVEAVNKDTIFVGTANGINISFDGGVSWKKYNAQNSDGIPGNFVRNISYNPVDKSIWASCKFASPGENLGLCVSYDFGETWTSYLEGIEVWYTGFKNSDILAPTSTDGLLRSSDGGSSWLEVGKIEDVQTELSINTKYFYTASSLKKNDNSYDIWVCSQRGLAMMNEVSSPWDGNWKVFLEKGSTGTESYETYAFPNPFRPKNSVVNIKYYLNKESAQVSIRIMDFGMNLVRTVLQNADRYNKGDKLETWDGKDQNGSTVKNGVYFYRIDIDSEEPQFGKILIVQ